MFGNFQNRNISSQARNMPSRLIQQNPSISTNRRVQNITNNNINPNNQRNTIKRKKKVGDRLLPKKIRQLIPESESYMQMLELEKQLDQVLIRRRLSIQEEMKKPCKIKKKLRLILSTTLNSNINVNNASSDQNLSQMGPGWELRVEGRLIDENNAVSNSTNCANAGNNTNVSGSGGDIKAKRKFSTYFKSLVIELDKDLYGPDNHLVEWHRNNSTPETDGFQVKRPGNTNVKCKLFLMLDFRPPQYKLEPHLARVLGIHTDTRAQIIYALWNYIKTQKLQDPHERDYINCDQYLEQIFQAKRIKFAEIPNRLTPLLLPPDPIIINHIIQVDGEETKQISCYDIDVELDDNYKTMLQNYAQNATYNQEISSLDGKIHELVDQINQTKLRREFFLEYSNDPQKFITRWLASQCRDLKVMTETGPGQPEEERKADYFNKQWTREAVMRYFYNKINQRRQELEAALNLNSI